MRQIRLAQRSAACPRFPACPAASAPPLVVTAPSRCRSSRDSCRRRQSAAAAHPAGASDGRSVVLRSRRRFDRRVSHDLPVFGLHNSRAGATADAIAARVVRLPEIPRRFTPEGFVAARAGRECDRLSEGACAIGTLATIGFTRCERRQLGAALGAGSEGLAAQKATRAFEWQHKLMSRNEAVIHHIPAMSLRLTRRKRIAIWPDQRFIERD